jgi:hypothetical protein
MSKPQGTIIDPRLLDYASDQQREALIAVSEFGSIRAAAKKLKVNESTLRRKVQRVEKKAAREGYAPGHWDHGVPPGYLVDKATLQRKNPDGTFSWIRLKPDQERVHEACKRSSGPSVRTFLENALCLCPPPTRSRAS